ncbi:MAG: ThuA domain-containing protein [Pirellulales bacterium]
MIVRVLLALLLVAVCPAGVAICDEGAPRRLLIIGQGPDGHPPGSHEFMAGTRVLERLLQPHDRIETTVVKADEPWPEGPELIAKADGVVLLVTQGARWMQNDPRRFDALVQLAQRGGGIVALHWSVGAHEARYIEGQLQVLGGSRGGPQRKYTVTETDVQVVAPDHPITAGIDDYRVHDEFYYRLDLVRDGDHPVQPLLAAKIEGNDETCAWAWERPDGGRSFGFVCLHFHKNWDLPHYRRLVVQGVLWTLKLPVPEDGVDVSIEPEVLELTAGQSR